MSPRISQQEFFKLQPALPEALISMGEAAVQSGLEPSLIHLLKLRVSQINGCAFCQHMHAGEARKDGESQERLDVLQAWREVPVFSERESAALAWAEALTLVSGTPPDETLYETVRGQFDEAELANLMAIIVAINGWNRIAVGLRFIPPITVSRAA